MTEQTEQKIFKGTTTVGVTFKDGVVIAADKRASFSTFIASREVEKIQVVGDRVAMTMAGGVGDAQTLVRIMKAELALYKYSRGQEMSIKGAATLLANVLQGNKYFPYLVQMIVAGFDVQPRLFDLDPLGGLMEERYVSTGSGSVVAYGVLDDYFKDGMSQDDAVRLAVKAVSSAMKRDSATGDGIDALVVTEKGIKRFSKDEVKNFLAK
ncbi:archaeal proteasome endopeptidase complex subunit beta [Candidatus Micrarchaeota archaeon]|nr:archaeal proteasome endopeptidase complex subunit beta [Candidatus Micrarchaeota archaeon]